MMGYGDCDMARVVNAAGDIVWHSDGGDDVRPDDGSCSDALRQARNDALALASGRP